MGQKTVLTNVQKKFLGLVLKEPYLLKHYYWTGGTVLSEIYLHHRESRDIDLFTEHEVHLASINKFVGISGALLHANKISYSRFLGLHSYVFTFDNDKADLKIDFNFYPFPRIDKRSKWKGLTIDSLFDIAVNKIQTLSTNPRARDFVDLYFIFQQQEQPLTLKRLIEFAKIKFDWHIEPVQLGENFAKVITFQDFPKIYLPFERKTMTNFFLSLSRELKTEIFTNPTS